MSENVSITVKRFEYKAANGKVAHIEFWDNELGDLEVTLCGLDTYNLEQVAIGVMPKCKRCLQHLASWL